MERFPLSKTEYGIYVEQITTGNTAYNVLLKIALGSNVDLERLSEAIRTVVGAHPNMKAAFALDENGEVYKYIRDCQVEVKVIEGDIDPYTLVRPFDLYEDVLFRFYILKSAEGNALFMDIHHIVFDGTSVRLFVDQVSRAYAGEAVGAETFSACDYAREEAARLGTKEYEEAKAYYQQTFEGLDADSSFFPDRNDREPRAKEVAYPLAYVDYDQLRELATRCGVKLSTVMNGAFAYVLSRYAGNEQVLFSTIYHGRDERTEDAIGMFVKTYPVFADLSGDPSIAAFLQQLDRHIMRNRENGLYSFADFCTDTKLTPNILFGRQTDLLHIDAFCGSPSQMDVLPPKDSRFDLEMTVRNRDGRFTVYAIYKQDLYDDEILRGMLDCLDKVLKEMTVKEKLSDIEMLSDAQREGLDSLNDTDVPYDDTQTVVSLFRRQAKATPDKEAVVFKDNRYTYKEVDELTDRIAAYIASKGLGLEDAVSVLIPRSEWMVIASLGILKAGCAYQPLDPSYPKERLNFMVKDAAAKLLIADESLRDLVDEYQGEVLLTKDLKQLPPAQQLPEGPKPESLFILLYTSGSTGVPKGCQLTHSNLVCYCNWYWKYYNMKPEHHVAVYASYGFDVHQEGIYPAVTGGATVFVIPEEMRLDLIGLNKYFEQEHITNAFLTTQVAYQFATTVENHSLLHMTCGGEKLASLAPPSGYQFYNGYGPTEATIIITIYPIKQKDADVPIGKPLNNVRLYVVDAHGHRLPKGALGELWVAGPQVARGYLNRPDKTAEVFISNPFSDEQKYKPVYRTGDIVRYLSDGNIQFVGRRDGQVKIRGFRIELKEVEAVIREFPGIKDATVQAFDNEGGEGKFIAAYIVSDEQIDVEALNNFILAQKPPYMVPAVTMQIDSIPLNQNQKVNKKALPKPEITVAGAKKQAVQAPLNVLEKEIKDIVSTVINTTEFGITDLFRDLGLTSIASIKLAMLVYNRFGVQINSRKLLSEGNIQSIENEVLNGLLMSEKKDTSDAGSDPQPPNLGGSSVRLSFPQQGVFAECQANPESVRYNLPFVMNFPDGISEADLESAVRKVIDAHQYILCHFVANSNDEIVQEPIPDCRIDIPVKTMTEAEFEAYKKDFVRPFDLEKGPCIRFEIVKGDQLHLLLDMHHLVSDGYTIDLFFERLCEALDGKPVETEGYTYYEFAAEQKISADTEDFFRQQMAEVEEATQLIPDVYAKDLPHTEKSTAVKTDIAAVTAYAKQKGITPAAVYLAACYLTFGRYVCEDIVSIITISNGRSNLKVNNTFGMFVNTLPMVMTLNHKEKTTDYLQRVAQSFADTLDHEDYPFARIASQYEFHPSISYAYQIGVINDYRTKCGSVSTHSLDSDIAKVPISIFIDGSETDAQIIVTYDTSMYSDTMMDDLARCLENATQGLIACENVSQISLTDETQWQLLDSYNKPWDLDYDMTDSVATRFKKIVAANPDKKAAVFKDKAYTYKELDELTDSLAAKIYKIGCEITGKTDLKEEVAAIILPRNEQTIILPLATVKAGMGYEPLDPSYPKERLNFMVKDASVSLLIADDNLCEVVDEYKGKTVTVSELYAMDEPDTKPVGPKPESLFIMLYTSGSTGAPKGCQIENRNIVAYAHGMRHTFYTKDDNVAAYASFSFDVNMADVFCSLLVGATVDIVPEEDRMDLDRLAAYFDRARITTLLLTTQVGVQFAQNYPHQETLRLLIIAGEKCPAIDPSAISYPIANGYGPTENCCGVSVFPIKQWEPNIPIGQPIPTIHAYILDKTNHRLPAGAAGEYCLSGPQTSRGYLNRPDKTAEAYEPCPFNEWRMYHTGDIVRYRHNGDVEFVGRKDGQVKIRGFRIETKEVETVIRGFEGIKDVTVQAYDYESGGKYLAAFVVGNGTIDTDAVAAYVKSQKPAYMVPAVIMQIDKIPLTVNMKVDKKALPKPERKAADYVAPANKTEEDICGIFSHVLGVERVSAEDDFFEIGGSSILAMKVVIAAEKAGYKLVYNDVFSYTTPRMMAEFLGAETEGSAETEVNGEAAANAVYGVWTPPEVGADGYDYSKIHELLSRNTLETFHSGKRNQVGDVLLLGGTGYLGSHVLRELIKAHDGKIYCFVRPGKEESGEERLKAMQRYYFGDDNAALYGSRIFVVEGDATDPASLEQFKAPHSGMTVVNCAASVKHFAKGNEIERANVESVKNLAAWCLRHDARLVHISTGSIMGSRKNGLPPVNYQFTEQVLFAGQEINSNQYIHSKFMAERFIYEQIMEHGLRAKVCRVGNLAPRSDDGEFQINYKTNSYMNSLNAFRALGVIGFDDLNVETEFSPIDCVAKAVLALAQTPDDCICFQPLNPHRPLMSDVIHSMNDMGFSIRGAENEEVAEALNKALADEKTSGAVGSLIAYNSSDGSQEISFDSINVNYTACILERLGFSWPETGSAYMHRFLKKLDEKGFFV